MGNIFGRRAGRNNDLAPVMSGSHIDSQPKGGRFDGILGVMGPLEVLRTLHENGVETERPVVIVDWTNEEGSRFAPAMVASGVWAGALERDWAYDRTDINGKRFGEELERIGYKGTVPGQKMAGARLLRIPHRAGADPGAGEKDHRCAQGNALSALVRHLPRGRGQPGRSHPHGGPPRRALRRRGDDPQGQRAARPHGRQHGGHGGGDPELPQLPQHHPGQGALHGGYPLLGRRAGPRGLGDACATISRAIAERRGCPIRIEETWRVEHSPFDEKLVQRILDVAEALGYPSLHMVSGAGHDASYMNQIAPTAMIFVPSIGGRSHVEVENTTWEDCEAGANVLLHSILQSANEI